MTAILLVLAAFLPLALAMAHVPLRTRPAVALLVPFAPLPALIVALVPEPGAQVVLPEVLLGLQLGLDGTRRLVLGFTALLWLAAAVYGRGYFRRDPTRHRYDAFFLVTMGGNLGLVVALDVPGFYLFFSLMTLSSYMLVVFEGTPKAYRAGRVYISLSLLGETMLLLGFLRAVRAADSLLIADIPAALARGAGGEGLTLLLLFAGFAVKAGQMPLHVWLPLAHPAAPTPASAVLSGAMIKAGLLGMILFLPVGEAGLPALGLLLTVIGLGTAFYGVACGLPQADPKTVLAYSSLSQMGVLVAALGSVIAQPLLAPAVVPAVVLYAVHHGLAKAALFFAVGVVQKSGRGHLVAMAVAALCAASIAGLPLTAGGLAKFALKDGLDQEATGLAATVVALLPLSAMATTALLLRLLVVLDAEAGSKSPEAGLLLRVPFLVVAGCAQLLPWFVALETRPGVATAALSAYGLWEAAWPPALAAILVAGLVRFARGGGRIGLPQVPEGDLIALLPDADRFRPARGAGPGAAAGHRLRAVRLGTERAIGRASGALSRLEVRLRGQGAAAAAFLLLSGGLLVAVLA